MFIRCNTRTTHVSPRTHSFHTTYDGDGKRVKKKGYTNNVLTEETIFVYDVAGKLIAEYSSEIASVNDAKVAYLTNDHLGSPRVNTDQNGAVTARHDYHPFGEEIVTSHRIGSHGYADDTVRKQFTGYERDGETGLDFAQARMYQSSLGRFSGIDPVYLSLERILDPQRLNLFVYCRNNPIRFVDPSGMKLEIEAKNEEEARKRFALLQKGLKKQDRNKINFVVGDGKNGFSKGAFGVTVDQKHKSDSGNFKMLKTIADDKDATGVITFVQKGEGVRANFGEMKAGQPVLVSFKASTGTDFLLGPWSSGGGNVDIRGWTTFPLQNPPNDGGYPIYSDDDKTRANVYEGQTEMEVVATMFHELAAHVYLSNVGRKPPDGFHGRNEVEKETKRSEEEAKKNFNQK